MKKLFMILPLVLVLCFTFGCQKNAEKVERFIEDGVEVIVNHLEPYKIRGEPSSLILEETFTIDTERDDIAEIGLTNIWSVDVDSEDNIYLLNDLENKDAIFKFDNKGNFVTSFGRKGQGPGELRWAMYLRVSPKDDIMVADSLYKLVVFKKDGSYKNQIIFKSFCLEALFLENGNYLVKKSIPTPETKYMEFPLVLLNGDFEEIKELDRYRRPDHNIGEEFVLPFHKSGNCVSERQIYVGNTEMGYEIRVYDFEGNLKKKIRKEFQPVKVHQEMKQEILRRYGGSVTSRKYSFRSHCPAFRYFFVDDEGYLFVMTYEKSELPREYIYDVFNPDGLFITRTSLGNPSFYMIWNNKFATARNNRIYCLRNKESEYKELVVYKMRWE